MAAGMSSEAKKVSRRYREYFLAQEAVYRMMPDGGDQQNKLLFRRLAKEQHESTVAHIKSNLEKEETVGHNKVLVYEGKHASLLGLQAAIKQMKDEHRTLLLITHLESLCPVEAVDDVESAKTIDELLLVAHRLKSPECGFRIFGLADKVEPLNNRFVSEKNCVGEDKEPL